MFDFNRKNFVQTAREKLGSPYVSHAEAIKGCWTRPTKECFTTGLGPDSFDCSGFVIASLAESCNQPIASWRKDVRHVREFWQDGVPSIGERVEVEEVLPGDILIFQRLITVEGVRGLFPCHASIVTSGNRSGLRSIGTSHEIGRVVEGEVGESQRKRILGAIALNPARIFN